MLVNECSQSSRSNRILGVRKFNWASFSLSGAPWIKVDFFFKAKNSKKACFTVCSLMAKSSAAAKLPESFQLSRATLNPNTP